MEKIGKTNSHLKKSQKKARFDFSVKYLSFNWNNVVFMGLNEINGVKMIGMISRFDGCEFRVTLQLTAQKYESFLDNVILPMWKANQNLVFMHVR